jgi:hypothetical protein
MEVERMRRERSDRRGGVESMTFTKAGGEIMIEGRGPLEPSRATLKSKGERD